jgi:hypothetical protein
LRVRGAPVLQSLAYCYSVEKVPGLISTVSTNRPVNEMKHRVTENISTVAATNLKKAVDQTDITSYLLNILYSMGSI